VTRRRMLPAVLALAASALVGCASHVDTVDPADYLNTDGDGMYRTTTPYAEDNVPPAVPFPESCVSPPSFSGAPEHC